MDKSSRALQVLIPNSIYRVYVCTLVEYVRRSLLTWTRTANEDLHLTLSTVDNAF